MISFIPLETYTSNDGMFDLSPPLLNIQYWLKAALKPDITDVDTVKCASRLQQK